MKIEFDPAKNASNREKHGLDFAGAKRVWLDPSVVDSDTTRVEDGERRYKAIGVINDNLHTVVYTLRGDIRRIISFRRSN